VIPILWLGQPSFLTENLTGFAASRSFTKALAITGPWVWIEPGFAETTFLGTPFVWHPQPLIVLEWQFHGGLNGKTKAESILTSKSLLWQSRLIPDE